MGRRARPVEQLLRDGKKHLTKREIRQRQEAEARLTPPSDAVKPPAWLGLEGQREWKRITGAWDAIGLLTNVDVTALAVYCDAVDKYAQATREVQANGVTITNDKGNLIQNPAVLAATKYAAVIARYGSQFGLTPSARASLAIPRGDEDKPEDEFAARFGS